MERSCTPQTSPYPRGRLRCPPRSCAPPSGYIVLTLAALRRARKAAHVLRRERCGAILTPSGDPFDSSAGYLASRLARVPFYAYFFDDYLHQWNHTIYYSFAQLAEPIVLNGAAGVITLNEFLREEHRRRYVIESTIIHNPIEVSQKMTVKEVDDTPPWPAEEGETRIVYIGTVSMRYHHDAFRNLIEAIGQLGRPEVKLGEYLPSGWPILAHAPTDSFVSWYFREHKCAVVVDQSEPAALAWAIQHIFEDPDLRRKIDQRARARAGSDFSFESARAEFLKLLLTKMKKKKEQ